MVKTKLLSKPSDKQSQIFVILRERAVLSRAFLYVKKKIVTKILNNNHRDNKEFNLKCWVLKFSKDG